MAGRAIDFTHATSLTAVFYEQAEALARRPMLWSKHDGAWRSRTWAEAAEDVTALANGLIESGIHHGDRIVIVSENRPEWTLADLAILAAGAITTPAYTTNTVNDHLHILNDADAAAVIVSNAKLAGPVLQAAAHARRQPLVVVMEPAGLRQNPGVETLSWDDLRARGAGKHRPDVVARTRRHHTACIIYTSGTGGAPKGVVLTHGAILRNCAGAHKVLLELGLEDEVFLSFLPLSHAYEHTAGQFFPLTLGAQIYYAESVDALSANLLEARPTIVTAVPRLYEVLRQKVLHGVKRQGGSKEVWFNRTVDLGLKRQRAPQDMTIRERVLDVLCTLLVRRKVAQRFGGRLKAFVSGGAPLNPEVGMFFTAIGVRILQGYGQTEAAPVISVNIPSHIKMETVGPPLEGVELKIAGDGEICVRGEMVMRGYWNNPETTAQVIDEDGWLHTGDIGELDDEGYLRITDRKKDIIVNSGGDNISPQRVEGFLCLEPEIAQAMVYGDKRPHLVALVVPDAEFAAAWARQNGRPADLQVLVDDAEFRRAMADALDRVNRTLSQIEKIRRFTLVADPFTVENEMMTPTLKIRRHVIRQTYGERLETMYS
ncbi:AMP-dependent synthetase/ligase [Novispirillum sp. DQ9]|uniref:AMP-dependent synthetase/ligase n=1 Tax=Novispirillum sp. DQ9 TaxID=3398612 RepID=UPI003C7B57D2